MSRNVVTFVAAGTALGLGGIASAQTELSSLDLNRAYASELSADSLARMSAQADRPESAGFTIASGGNSLNIGALFQFGYVANFRDDDATDIGGQDNEFTHGFDIRRARLDFSGTAVNSAISYRISGDFGEINSGGENDLQVTWAYGEYAFSGGLDGVKVRFGQFKLPLYFEELVEPEYLLAVDRSLTNEAFSQQYSQGLQFSYEADSWRGTVAVSDGLGTAGTRFNSGGESDVALTGRFDYKFSGDWSAFDDFSSFRNSENAFRVGAGIHWQTFGDTNPADSGVGGVPLNTGVVSGNLIAYTADLSWEGNGWSLFAAFFGQSIVDGELAGGADSEPNDFGVVVQGAYFVTDQWELFARYDGLYLDDDERTGFTEDNFNFLTVGGTYYFVPESHALKFTTDIVFAFDGSSDLVTLGLLDGTASGSSSGTAVTGLIGQEEDPEIAVRAQFSLTF